MSWKSLLILLMCLGELPARAAAEPFWIAYEADDGRFPEEVGWQRITYGGGAERWFEDGALVLDGLASTGIEDFYRMDAPIGLDPGEVFVMQWRLRTDEVPGLEDPGINFTVLGEAALTLLYSESTIFSSVEGLSIAAFDPGVFHDYLLISEDLDTYTLRIDGELVYSGALHPTGWESGIQWGDYSRSARSMSTWSSVRFGVVAEPSGSAILGLAALLVIVSSPRRWRQCHEIV